MIDISLHIFDIAQNAVDAGADHIFISVSKNRFVMSDNGSGMDEETKRMACADGFTTRENGRGGHGLHLLWCNAESLTILSTKGVGTLVDARFPETFPEGKIALTLQLLLSCHPEIAWIFTIYDQNAQFTLDTRAERRDCMKEETRNENH